MDHPQDTDAVPQLVIRAARLTPSIDEARLTLARLLAGNPGPEQVLAAAAALAILDDTPEVPPTLGEKSDPLPWDEGRELALTQLRTAIDEAATIEELTRIATAALELRNGSPSAGEAR